MIDELKAELSEVKAARDDIHKKWIELNHKNTELLLKDAESFIFKTQIKAWLSTERNKSELNSKAEAAPQIYFVLAHGVRRDSFDEALRKIQQLE